MTPSVPRIRSSRAAMLVAAMLLAVLVWPAGIAGATIAAPAPAEVIAQAEADFVVAINAARAAEGLGPLTANAELADIARAWSVQLDAAGRLSHNPHYTAQYSGEWTRMGENVGYASWPGASMDRIVPYLHDAFMRSSGHRANIMGDYNQVGVGVVVDGPTTWVTVNFLQGPLSPEPEPAPEPPADPATPELPLWPRHYVRG